MTTKIDGKRRAFYVARYGNVAVPIHYQRRIKNGVEYRLYTVSDYSTGQRKRLCFSDIEEAKDEANSIAQRISQGEARVDFWPAREKRDAACAVDMAREAGFELLPGVSTLASLVKLLGSLDKVAEACRYFHDHPPTRPTTPKTVTDAVKEFLGRQSGASPRWKRTLKSYLDGTFAGEFGPRQLHEIAVTELAASVESMGWSPVTRRHFLGAVATLYADAQERGIVPKDCNPVKEVRRPKVKAGDIGIFTPGQLQKLLNTAGDLTPFLACWALSGLRKDEAARLTWEQIDLALASGSIYLTAGQAKKAEARSIPVCDALRAWLMKFRKRGGPILPERWRRADAQQQIARIDCLSRHLANKAGVEWVSNAPRHSYATYFLKQTGDPMLVARIMGNSLQKLQRHYVARSESITKEMAAEWFAVVPVEAGVIVPMPVAATA